MTNNKTVQGQKQISPLRCGMTNNKTVQGQKQISPLRCGMTNKKTNALGMTTRKTTSTAEAKTAAGPSTLCARPGFQAPFWFDFGPEKQTQPRGLALLLVVC